MGSGVSNKAEFTTPHRGAMKDQALFVKEWDAETWDGDVLVDILENRIIPDRIEAIVLTVEAC